MSAAAVAVTISRLPDLFTNPVSRELVCSLGEHTDTDSPTEGNDQLS